MNSHSYSQSVLDDDSNVTSVSNQSDQSTSINLIVSKLGHDLEEIRSRSLDSLISKLDSQVLTEQDLVQHKQLFVKLLELFNFKDFKQQDKVLSLLLVFSKNKSAVKNIQDICGLQFLNSLKSDLKDQNQRVKIEQIIDQLIETSSNLEPSFCNSNSEAPSISFTTTVSNTFNSDDLEQLRSIQSQLNYNETSSGANVNRSNIEHTTSCYSIKSKTINSNDLSLNTKNAFKNEYKNFENDKSTFYWLPLTLMDKQFLSTAENSLKSNDPKKIKSYCTFLQTIVFNDFPAEIFLQRSSILKILIDLITKSTINQVEVEDSSLLKCLISCFNYYCTKLKKRISYIKDPSTFCYKDFYSNGHDYFSKSIYSKKTQNLSLYPDDNHSIASSAISSIKSSSTLASKTSKKKQKNPINPETDETLNQDLQNSIDTYLTETNTENYETDADEMHAIKLNQEWPIHSFCFRLIDTLIDNLNLIFLKNQPTDTSLLPTICETINSLIEILNETKPEWSNINLTQTNINLFHKLNYNIKHLQASNNISNRVIYIYLTLTLYKIINIIHSTDETSLHVPVELSGTLFTILNDICLTDSFKSVSSVFSEILINLDKELYDIYTKSNEICESMRSACEFLIKHDQLSLKHELIEMGKKSIIYMDHHNCVDLATKLIEFSSKVLATEGSNSNIEDLVTKCMMSQNDEIRVKTYTAIYKITTESLNIQIATEINSQRHKNLNFLLQSRVFHQFITFGLFDKSVKKICEKTLLHLLQCELLVPESFRLKLTQLIVIYMPFIQCIANNNTDSIGKCIIKMSDDLLTPTVHNANSKHTEDSLKLFLSPAIERLRCSMRYLFSKDKAIRKIGYQQSIGFLTKYHRLDQVNDEDGDANQPGSFNLNDFFQKFPTEKCCDLVTSLKRRNRVFMNNNNNVFQTENLVKIYNIFVSETVDFDVRQNSAEQLSIMLGKGDLNLHKAFISLDGVNQCIRYLRNTSSNKSHLFLTNIEKETLSRIQSSCVFCLTSIFYWNKHIRQIYQFDIEIYRLIFKSLLLSFNNQDTQEDLSILLFIILFHQVSSIDYYHRGVGDGFDLSVNLKENFLIPFSIPSAKCQEFRVNDINLDKSRFSEVLDRKFRLFWNFNWHGGSMMHLCEDLMNNEGFIQKSDTSSFNQNLCLTEDDKFLVKYSNPVYLVKQICNDINTCSTHQEALVSLDLIEVVVSMVNVYNNKCIIDDDGFNCDWHLALNRFVSIQPSTKSSMDQLLYSSSFRTISKILDLHETSPTIDKWLFNMIYSQPSSLLKMIKNYLVNYETDETKINSYLLPLCEFIKIYFNSMSESVKVPSVELLGICIDQMQACEIEKFRNLNKLAILINLIGSLLRVTCYSEVFNNRIFIQLIKSLVQIINIFNIGRGGLSLSFMGNFITKSAHVSLLQLVKNSLSNSDNSQKTEIVKAVLCLRDEKNNLNGSSWLIPLMLHREPQIRSISFCLISLLINVPYARTKLMTNQTSIWSIALNVLLNPYESSIARAQACGFLVNLTQSISPNNEDDNDESNISITALQLLLHEVNFYHQIAFILSTFYPFETYSFSELTEQNNTSKSKAKKSEQELSICSPILVSSICQLLYNLNILLNNEAILLVNNNGILSLLISYVKPVNLLTSKSYQQPDLKLNEDLIQMLIMICKYFNLCCQMDQNCVLMLLKQHQNNIVFDLIECLTIKASNVDRLNPFFTVLFDLLSTFLNCYDDKSTIETCLINISKCWQIVTNYILNDLLENDDQTDLFENGLKFYSIYLSKLTQLVNSKSSNNLQILFDNILYLFDSTEINEASQESLGALLAKKLIKQFDKYFLVDTNPSLKLIVSNLLKGLFVLSNSAKNVAADSGLIETLIEHLKYTHSKLNLKSLSLSKAPLKENTFVFDLQHTLLILKYLMCNNSDIKDSVCKSGLHSIIHSFWCWSLQDQNLLKASLSTLCTLTANNKSAINLMSQTNITPNGLSLLNSVIKSLQKSLINQTKSNFVVQKFSFSLLANCAQSNECKNIIWKSNLLQDFTTIDPQSLKSNSFKFNFKIEKLWLNFLVSLSFSTDGQQFFMKVESLLPTIIKFLDPMFFSFTTQQSQFQQQQLFLIQYLSLLILRNLAFNQSNKSKLISNADYISTLIQALKNKNEKFHILALNALDSLLYDYQKAKVILKNSSALKHLVDLYEVYSRTKNKSDQRILPIVNNLIKILNE